MSVTDTPLLIDRPADFLTMAGRRIGPSPALTITQDMIDTFARATGDHQWIHTDPERAARESPYGKTIAHGYLTLSLLAQLQDRLYRVDNVERAINYGANRLRLISPVPVDSQVQLTQTITAAEEIPGGVKVTIESVFALVGADKPALVVETIGLFFASDRKPAQ